MGVLDLNSTAAELAFELGDDVRYVESVDQLDPMTQLRNEATELRGAHGALFSGRDPQCYFCAKPLGKTRAVVYAFRETFTAASLPTAFHPSCARKVAADFMKDADLAESRTLTYRTDWAAKKIKGGLAEAVCRAHFEKSGFSVDRFGIEEIAPGYLAHSSPSGDGPYMSPDFQNFIAHLPDFMVSWKYDSGARAGRRDACLVDAKFRTSMRLSREFADDLFKEYETILRRGAAVMLYVVTRYAFDGLRYVPGHVFLNYCKFEGGVMKYRKWIAADDPQLDGWPMYGVHGGHPSFTEVCRTAIDPVLDEILSVVELPVQA